MIAAAYLGDTIYQIGAKNEAARAATIPALFAQIMYILPDFYYAGFPNALATTYSLAQMMLESEWLTSNLANTDNNYSGITWINKPYQNATKGIAKPKNEGGGYYAHFPSFRDWAKDYYRILSLNTGGLGRPIDAATAQQFLDRLKANHYFTDSNYYTKFNAALRKVGEALTYGAKQNKQYLDAASRGQTTFTHTAGEGLTSNTAFDIDRAKTGIQNAWDQLATWQKWGFGLGITGLFLYAIKN